MSGLTIPELGEVMRGFGFAETEKASHFRWYEYPSPSFVRDYGIPVYVRSMFYEPRSELQVWVIVRGPGVRGRIADGDFSGYAKTLEEATLRVARSLEARQRLAVEELVKWNDHRVPFELASVARSPRQDERLQAERVIADLLLDRGVPF